MFLKIDTSEKSYIIIIVYTSVVGFKINKLLTKLKDPKNVMIILNSEYENVIILYMGFD